MYVFGYVIGYRYWRAKYFITIQKKSKNKCITVERRTVETDCSLATLVGDFLLEAALMLVGKVWPPQLVHELQLLLLGEQDVGAVLADHLSTQECLN